MSKSDLQTFSCRSDKYLSWLTSALQRSMSWRTKRLFVRTLPTVLQKYAYFLFLAHILISSQYLSPERARGLPHDTRKADIWSLGVSFFEILIGRTPFEHTEGEPFVTKTALEDYWARTVCTLAYNLMLYLLRGAQMRGKWLGSWKMSKGAEKMLRRMIQPNADLRCTAPEVLQDLYWDAPLPASGHKKSASSGTPDKSKSYNGASPLSSRRGSRAQRPEREQTKKYNDKENLPITVPNPKKTPARQRVLSGTDGLSQRFLSMVDVNDP